MLREGRDSISFHNFALLEMELSYKWRVFYLRSRPLFISGGGGGFVGFQLCQYEIYLIPPRVL